MQKDLSWLIDKFIAHAGFHDEKCPVNSLAAFSRAIEYNYAIECDLREIEDGVVVFHDKELGRLTGKDGYVSQLKKEDLKDYTLCGTDQTLISLDELLAFVDGKTPIVLDIKTESSSVGKFEQKILNAIKNYNGQIAVMSFNPFTVEWFKKNAPQIPRGLLTTKWTKDLPDIPKSFIKRFVTSHNLFYKRADPDFVAFNIDNLPSIQTKKFKNKIILGWTVRSQEQYLDKIKNVDNIIFENFKPKI